MKSNLTKSVLALFIFVLYYCLTVLAFIPLADGDAIYGICFRLG